MSRVFITGSSDGLGKMAAQLLVEQGHSVVLHARNKERARDAHAAVPQAEKVLSADLASYILTALIYRPKRLVYVSSGLHQSGDVSLDDLAWE